MSRSAIRLLVVGEFEWNCGSSHVVKEYARHGLTVGIEVKVSTRFGNRDAAMTANLPLVDDLSWGTHLCVVLEGNAFLTDADIAAIDSVYKRSRRLVVDADGHWCPSLSVGDDDNDWPYGKAAWRRHIASISDTVLQPRAIEPCAGAVAFPYFGMPEQPPSLVGSHEVHVQYVGANWFRSAALTEIFRAARAAIGPGAMLRVCGTYWDGSARPGFEHATRADIGTLDSLGVVRSGPVPFGAVVRTMSNSVLTPVLVRPVLSKMSMITPRMFETLVADTIPMYRDEDHYIGEFLRDDGRFSLGDDPASRIADFISDQPKHVRVARELREQMYAQYSYPAVLRQLLTLLQ